MADLVLVFKGASILFSKVVILAYIPTSSSFFPASLPAFAAGGGLDRRF
jgi:hypothetical protein